MVRFALLVLAGFGGGLTGSVAGLASLVSYPALLATGLNPVGANVTNTVALVFSTVGSASGSRPELRNQSGRLRRLAPMAVLGGIAGGALLLLTPAGAFARIVPVLIFAASLGVLIRRAPAEPNAAGADPRWLPLGVFAIGVYGGYFGAAAGVLLLALLLLATHERLPRSNALKNVLLGLSNAVAALGFIVFGHVHWYAAFPLALGLFVGARLGPMVVRRAPATPLKLIIAAAGVGLAVKLGLDAY